MKGYVMYNILIFDLDDTLTDNYENVKEAFKFLLKNRNEKYTQEKFEKFHKIDIETWRARANGKIITPFENDLKKKVEWIRASRFIRFYGENNITYEDAVKSNDIKKKTEWIRASRFLKFYGEDKISYQEAVKINDIYMEGMKLKVVPQKNTYEIIKYLYEKKYRIIIATNGPKVALSSKLEKLGINKFIELTFCSEEIGFMKPHENYYKGLFRKANIKDRNGILFIGDDLEKDIKGGIQNNLDTCWCNYNNIVNNTNYKPKYEINSLLELKSIL